MPACLTFCTWLPIVHVVKHNNLHLVFKNLMHSFRLGGQINTLNVKYYIADV